MVTPKGQTDKETHKNILPWATAIAVTGDLGVTFKLVECISTWVNIISAVSYVTNNHSIIKHVQWFFCLDGVNFFDTPTLMVVFHSTKSMLVFQLKNSLQITPKKFALDLQVMQLFLNGNKINRNKIFTSCFIAMACNFALRWSNFYLH